MDLFLTFVGLLAFQGVRRLPAGRLACVRWGPFVVWVERAGLVWRPPACFQASFELEAEPARDGSDLATDADLVRQRLATARRDTLLLRALCAAELSCIGATLPLSHFLGWEGALRAVLVPIALLHSAALVAFFLLERWTSDPAEGSAARLWMALLFPPELFYAPLAYTTRRLAGLSPLAVAAGVLPSADARARFRRAYFRAGAERGASRRRRCSPWPRTSASNRRNCCALPRATAPPKPATAPRATTRSSSASTSARTVGWRSEGFAGSLEAAPV